MTVSTELLLQAPGDDHGRATSLATSLYLSLPSNLLFLERLPPLPKLPKLQEVQ